MTWPPNEKKGVFFQMVYMRSRKVSWQCLVSSSLPNIILLVTVGGLKVHACVETKRIGVEHRFEVSEESIAAPSIHAVVDFSGVWIECRLRQHP